MIYTYKKLLDLDGNVDVNIIYRNEDGAYIPADEANTDYQEYLKWLSDGNTPEEADSE